MPRSIIEGRIEDAWHLGSKEFGGETNDDEGYIGGGGGGAAADWGGGADGGGVIKKSVIKLKL